MKYIQTIVLFIVSTSIANFSWAENIKEEIDTVQIRVLDKCLITPSAVIDGIEAGKPESLIAGTIAASILADVVKSGVNALGDAIEKASQQTNFVAEGTTSLFWSTSEFKGKLVAAIPKTKCFILFKAGNKLSIDNLGKESAINALPKNPMIDLLTPDNESAVIKTFKANGIEKIPSLYIEFYIQEMEEGIKVWPLLVWYKDILKGAPKGAANSELHVYFALPAYGEKTSDIGSVFSFARIKLPKISPAQLLNWEDLKTQSSIILPGRTNEGFVANKITSLNQIITQYTTRKTEKLVADRALEAAKEKVKIKATDENKAAVVLATQKVSDIEKDLDADGKKKDAIRLSDLGATNVKSRFVVIKDASKFGLAIASALKAQAQPIATAAFNEIKPKGDDPEWVATQTAYVSAAALVNQKRAEYDDAVLKGDKTLAIKLEGELSVAKAKHNEAAVALSKPVPYPLLLE